jgi:hypothetical protein
MKQLVVVFYILMGLVSCSQEVFANTWPKLINGEEVGHCKEALQIAQSMFQSNEFYLYAPPVIPNDFGSVLVLSPEALDISGGDALDADEDVFEKMMKSGEEEGSSGNIYWQKNAKHGLRLVVQESPFGWRGDMYSLFVIGEKVRPDIFWTDITKNQINSEVAPIISDSWRPPLIFQVKYSDKPWVIDVNQPYQFLGDWQIYSLESAGMKLYCSVQFHPNVSNAINLLPVAVRKLANLLDGTLGSGKDEGTLQQTARLRIDVEYTWANAAMRPWALREPYNTRKVVDEGLKKWSLNGGKYLQIYQAIKHQYPLAKRSLAEYYQKNFHRTSEEAKSLAAYSLDIAFRSYYAFHSEEPNRYYRNDPIQSNPWRSK